MHLKYSFLFLMLLMTGCSNQQALPTDHYYRLPELIGVSKGEKRFHLVSIINFQADGLLNERAIVYTHDDIEFNQYHYHNWVDAPSRLLTERLAEWFRLSDFSEVVLTTYEGNSELIIKGKIKSFERLRYGNNDSVRVGVVLQVNSHDKNLPVLFEEYSEIIVAESHSITDAVIAFGKAVDSIFTQFQDDLNERL